MNVILPIGGKDTAVSEEEAKVILGKLLAHFRSKEGKYGKRSTDVLKEEEIVDDRYFQFKDKGNECMK